MQNLRLLCDVVSLRSFSKAAQVHGITQSAASQRVLALERSLGVKLIDRSVRPLTATPPGELFHRHCLDILERYDELERRVREYRPEPAGHIRVDAIYSAGVELLNQVKTEFESQHPKVRVLVNYKHPDEVFEAVERQQCDLGVVSYPARYRGVDSFPLRDEIMAVVCGTGHGLASRKRLHVRELSGLPMIGFDPGLPVGRHLKHYFREHESHPRITNVFDNLDTIKAVVAVTDQVAILPHRAVRREVAAGSLVAISLEPKLVRPMGIIFRRRARAGGMAAKDIGPADRASSSALSHLGLLPAVQLFAEFLLSKIGPEDSQGEA
ncbi:MAG: LysR family transcriptional regulator [Phycisphaeraceae bacterium]|nr:LysR family transcriptional regulator [Phycisphaeraceae bacterium]